MTPRFGVYVPQGRKLDLTGFSDASAKFRALSAVALQAERLGFDAIWFYDHLQAVPPSPTSDTEGVVEATFECWSLLAALSSITTRIRLGSMVTAASFRPPSLLAKMASTVDVVSGGRLNLGIGSGWQESEYRAYGYPYPSARVRLEQMEEAVMVIKAMWTQTHATFHGRHFHIDNAVNEPKPLQNPHPPIWIGGGGEKMTLRIAARHATAVNFSGAPEDIAKKCAVLEAHCRDVGRNYDSILKSVNFEPVIIRPTNEEALTVAQELKPASYASVEQWRTRTLIGDPDYCRKRIRAYHDLGIAYFVCYFAQAAENAAPMELFAQEVVPALSAAG